MFYVQKSVGQLNKYVKLLWMSLKTRRKYIEGQVFSLAENGTLYRFLVFTTDVKEETWLGPTVVYSALVSVEDDNDIEIA